MTDRIEEQFDTPEQTNTRLQSVRASEQEWLGRQVSGAGAANAAALIALVSFAASKTLSNNVWPILVGGILFFIGLMLAFWSMVAMQGTFAREIQVYRERLTSLRFEKYFASRDPSIEASKFRKNSKTHLRQMDAIAREFATLPPSFLMGSLGCFLFGVLISSAGIADVLLTDRADGAINDRRCLALQKDMLSAHPRRSDGPDLFQALGCRPQGEGSVYAPPETNRSPDQHALQRVPAPNGK